MHYKRDGDHEELYIPGPLKQALTLMVKGIRGSQYCEACALVPGSLKQALTLMVNGIRNNQYCEACALIPGPVKQALTLMVKGIRGSQYCEVCALITGHSCKLSVILCLFPILDFKQWCGE